MGDIAVEPSRVSNVGRSPFTRISWKATQKRTTEGLRSQRPIDASTSSPVSSPTSDDSAPEQGTSAPQSVATVTRSLSMASGAAQHNAAIGEPLLRPRLPSDRIVTNRASIASTSTKSSSHTVLVEPPSLFPLNETFLPRAKPPPPLKKMPHKHKHSASVPMVSQSTLPLHSVQASTEPQRAGLAIRSLRVPFRLRRASSTGSIRPSSVYNTSDTSPISSTSSEESPVSPQSSGLPSLTRTNSCLTTASAGSRGSSHIRFAPPSPTTWLPPESWLGPPVESEESKKSTKKNSRMKPSGSNKEPSRFVVRSPSFWKSSLLDRIAEGGGNSEKNSLREVPLDRPQLVVTVEGQRGTAEKAVSDIIPQLRALRCSRR